jgi:hypothetical protein
VYSKVSYPDNEYGKVDWEYPKHENEDRMCVIVEIVVSLRFLRNC